MLDTLSVGTLKFVGLDPGLMRPVSESVVREDEKSGRGQLGIEAPATSRPGVQANVPTNLGPNTGSSNDKRSDAAVLAGLDEGTFSNSSPGLCLVNR